jgi:putative nucleotidyltransferase with HDIG domain
MKFNIPQEVLNIVHLFQEKKLEIYIVGGAVRDLLMGKIPDDWDFTTNAQPNQILKVLGDEAYYDNRFGTVGIPSKIGLDPHEITTYRTEQGYSDNRRPDKVEWGKTLEDDLQRRDFTMNALALRIGRDEGKSDESFEVIDLYGGEKDIKNKIIRAVGDPQERFSEDALRMMRAVRFASQLGFSIEEKTWNALSENSSLIDRIAKERVRDELMKIVTSPHPDHGIILLRDSGLLRLILPELEKTFGVEQKSPGRHHIYDVGTHSLMSLKYCRSSNPIVRFATLIHDIGKPITYKKNDAGLITFYNHEIAGASIARRIADRLRFSKRDTEKLFKLVRFHQFTVDEHQTDSAIRRFIRNVGAENIVDMLDLRVADRLGGGVRETSWRLEEFKKRLIEVQKQPFTVRDLKINGNDVMKELKLKPGPRVGEILNRIFKEVVERRIENEKEVLIRRLKELN